MSNITSKYKLFGGLPVLIFLNIIWLPLTWQVIKMLVENLSNPYHEWQGVGLGISVCLVFLQLLFLFLLMKECRYIHIDNEKIVYVNPILPFVRKVRFFNDYDYKQTVQEYSRGRSHEALWLIKEDKLKDRISSFYYANYAELKDHIKVEDKGIIPMNRFRQLGCLLGMKV